MPPKAFAKKLGGAAGMKVEDLEAEGSTPAPKGRRRSVAAEGSQGTAQESKVTDDTPLKRPATGKAKQAGTKRSSKNAEEGEEPAPKKRARKPKPEGPYTSFKEQGSIPEPELSRSAKKIPGKRLGLLSWNVGGLRAFLKGRIGDLQDAVRQASPDVIGLIEHKLQEDTSETSAALDALLEALPDFEVGAVSYSTAKKGYSGTLVLLRKGSMKPVKVSPDEVSCATNEGRLIVVEFETIFVVLCYVPNSGDGLKRLDERLKQWDPQLREKLKTMAKQKAVVLMGDLNVAHQDKDIWNLEAPHVPKSAGTTHEERESFSQLLASGFKDGFAVSHPEALGAFTYWSVRAGNRKTNKGLRLDYVLASEGMIQDSSKDTKSCPQLIETFHLPKLAPGDHCPIGAVVAV